MYYCFIKHSQLNNIKLFYLNVKINFKNYKCYLKIISTTLY